MATATEALTLKLKEILRSNGILSPVSEVLYGDSGLKGENFASETEHVTIKFVENDGINNSASQTPPPLHLFIKKQTSNPAQAVMLEDTKFFEKEILFFNKFIPVVEKYCKSLGRENHLNIYPKCYFADNSLLVFENLVVEKGYGLLPKLELQDFDSSAQAMETLGKHHGIGHAVINECGGPDKFFEDFPSFNFDSYWRKSMRDMIEPCMESGIDAILAVLEETKVDGSLQARDQIKSLKGKGYDKLLEDLTASADEFKALNHGDYWNNNMMFLKSSDGKIKGHVAVDFQQVKYNSPCIDLAYYLYSSVKPEVRRTKLRSLLEIYWNNFEKTTGELGHLIDPSLFKFEDLLKSFNEKFEFGFWFGTLLMNELSYAIFKEIDVSQFKDMSEWGVNHRRCTKIWIKNNPERCMEIGKNFVEILKEYEEVKNGDYILYNEMKMMMQTKSR